MKFIMVGSGAVGGYFGAKLQQDGHEVVFIARGKQLQALQENGITIQHDGSSMTVHPVNVTDELAAAGTADYVFLAVKTWQVDEIVRQLPALKEENTRFLTLQNGVEAPQIVAKVLGEEATFGGLVRGFFQMDEPGVIQHVGVQPTIIFGQADGGRSPQAEALHEALQAIGVYTELSSDITADLWKKFLLVTSLSGLGAITRSPIGEIRDYAPTYKMLRDAMQEIVNVGLGHGVALPDGLVQNNMAFIDTFPPEATTSMQRDLMSGYPSELEAQVGAVVRLGRKVNVPTPLNDIIYQSLILQERRARAT